ncbi:MAG: PorP/SprF family type IX secretion system membrane protein, partial [Bacteroidota bacterium]
MKKIILLVVMCMSMQSLFAQDPHFSQFYYSPLTLNPALTGSMNGTWRVGVNYRNQWGSISAPAVYATPSAFADFKILSGRFSGNYLGLGVLFLTDKAGDGQLTTSSAMISMAYHQSLDNTGNYHLSAGGMWGWTQKGIDLTRLDFFDEFTGTGFKPGFASLDPIQNTRFAYTDLMGGIAFDAMVSDYSRFTLGAAISHISKPKESFYASTSDNEIGTRYTVHAGGTFGVNNKVYILPYVLYQLQTSAQELVVGTALGYNFSPSRYKV